jgi:hypothetical protein
VLWLAFAIHSFAADALIATTNKQDIVRINRQSAAVIAPGTTVLAPMQFVFNEIENRPIRALMAAELSKSRTRDARLNLAEFDAYAESYGIGAVILDRERRDYARLSDAAVGERRDGFRVVAHFKELGRVVLVRD